MIFNILSIVTQIAHSVTRPAMLAKAGMKTISGGDDHSLVATNVDISTSMALLHGYGDFLGFHTNYPGSFSEENDDQSPLRSRALQVIQVDPLDGTGDMKDSINGPRPVAPTLLISHLVRTETTAKFSVAGGIIYNPLHGYGIASDCKEVMLFVDNGDGGAKIIKHRVTAPQRGQSLFLGRRVSYPQLVPDGPWVQFLKNTGLNVQVVPTGGAGLVALQFFRNFIEPAEEGAPYFRDLQPVSAIVNCMDRWKTWDTDPTVAIARALGLPVMTDMFGHNLTANASAADRTEMWHKQGTLLCANPAIQEQIAALAINFVDRNPDCPLICPPDSGYMNEIISMFGVTARN